MAHVLPRDFIEATDRPNARSASAPFASARPIFLRAFLAGALSARIHRGRGEIGGRKSPRRAADALVSALEGVRSLPQRLRPRASLTSGESGGAGRAAARKRSGTGFLDFAGRPPLASVETFHVEPSRRTNA